MAVRFKVIVTPGVSRKLNEILNYFIENVSVETALNVHAGIFDAIDALSTFPEAHSIARSISTRGIMYRRVMAMSFRIVYTVDKPQSMVVVVDIDRGKRSSEHLIKKLS